MTPQQRRPNGTRSPLPIAVKADAMQASIVQVALGDAHACACDALGGTYTWGRTREGQCGSVDVQPVRQPRLINDLLHESIIQVECGSDASYALTAGGSIYQWGAVHRPTADLAAANVAGYGRDIDSLSERDRTMLKESLTSFLSGNDEGGGSGEGAAAPTEGHEAVELVGTKRELRPTPERIELPKGERAACMAAGFGFGIIGLSGGGALAFGLNDRFQCGTLDRGVVHCLMSSSCHAMSMSMRCTSHPDRHQMDVVHV